MLPTLIHPCTLDPGGPCRDDEAYVVFYIVTKYQHEEQGQCPILKLNPLNPLNPPNPIAVIPVGRAKRGLAGIQLPWMANRKAVKIQP